MPKRHGSLTAVPWRISVKKSYTVAFCGIFTALAMIFSYIESFIPLPVGIPGVKLGLANAAVIVVLYMAGKRAAFITDMLRILLTGLLFGSMASFAFSLSGGLLSVVVMILVKKTDKFSIFGISVAGGLSHNIGQLAAAAAITGTVQLAYYLPVLLAAGAVTGIINGIIADVIKKTLHKSHINDML